MLDTIKDVKTSIIIHFANGLDYELPLVNPNYRTEYLENFCSSIKVSEKLYSSSRENIVGNVCGNTLSISAMSYDKLLVENNEDSAFYGYMNNTAYIDINVYIPEEDKTEYFGRYFVEAWESGTSADKSNSISITAVNLMSKIKNMTLNKIRLYRNMNINTYLKSIIQNINSRLPEHMQILYDDDDLDLFKNSSYTWQMYFNNIDRTDVESMFNEVAKCTASYIWIGRDRHLHTDHLLDDTPAESVCSISGATNILSYTNTSGGIDQASGIEVKYIEDVQYEDRLLLEIQNKKLYRGSNKLDNVKLNNSLINNIYSVEITCNDGSAYCTYLDNYKDIANLEIESDYNTEATIRIYGNVINETYGAITKYINDNNKENVTSITNRILIKELARTYVDGMVGLMSIKNNRVEATGYINPLVKLGDTIQFTGTKMNIDGYYKVVGMDFTLGAGYRCKVDLLKTFESSQNPDDILYNYNDCLYMRLMGQDISQFQFRDINNSENTYAYNTYKEEFDGLIELLG